MSMHDVQCAMYDVRCIIYMVHGFCYRSPIFARGGSCKSYGLRLDSLGEL